MPANSEGRLPIDYLDLSPEHTARASLANALEVLEQYRVKHGEHRALLSLINPATSLSPAHSDPQSTQNLEQSACSDSYRLRTYRLRLKRTQRMTRAREPRRWIVSRC